MAPMYYCMSYGVNYISMRPVWVRGNVLWYLKGWGAMCYGILKHGSSICGCVHTYKLSVAYHGTLREHYLSEASQALWYGVLWVLRSEPHPCVSASGLIAFMHIMQPRLSELAVTRQKRSDNEGYLLPYAFMQGSRQGDWVIKVGYCMYGWIWLNVQ